MPVPTNISQLSQTASSNSPAGSESPTTADDYLREYASYIAVLRDGKGFTDEVDVASASTCDIGAADSFHVRITGTTTITSFGTTYNGPRFVRFAGALTLTHNATTLILPSGANITTAAGDRAVITPIGNPAGGWQVLSYQKADGSALTATNLVDTTRIDVASASTVNLTSSAPNTRHINITGTTTITAFTVAVGLTYFVRFDGVLTLTNNASIVTNSGASITTAAGDTCIIRATAANTVEVLSYVGRATTAQAQAGTDVSRLITPSTLKDAQIVAGASATLTTQTLVDFDNVPSWAKKITIHFFNVSTNGTSSPIIQLGTASTFDTSGYSGSASTIAGTVASQNSSSGIILTGAAWLATAIIYGSVTIQKVTGNTWVANGILGRSDLAATITVGTGRTVSGTLTRVRLTTAGGVDQFDTGTVIAYWE